MSAEAEPVDVLKTERPEGPKVDWDSVVCPNPVHRFRCLCWVEVGRAKGGAPAADGDNRHVDGPEVALSAEEPGVARKPHSRGVFGASLDDEAKRRRAVMRQWAPPV